MEATGILGGNKLPLKFIDISLFRLISYYKVAMRATMGAISLLWGSVRLLPYIGCQVSRNLKKIL